MEVDYATSLIQPAQIRVELEMAEHSDSAGAANVALGEATNEQSGAVTYLTLATPETVAQLEVVAALGRHRRVLHAQPSHRPDIL